MSDKALRLTYESLLRSANETLADSYECHQRLQEVTAERDRLREALMAWTQRKYQCCPCGANFFCSYDGGHEGPCRWEAKHAPGCVTAAALEATEEKRP